VLDHFFDTQINTPKINLLQLLSSYKQRGERLYQDGESLWRSLPLSLELLTQGRLRELTLSHQFSHLGHNSLRNLMSNGMSDRLSDFLTYALMNQQRRAKTLRLFYSCG